MENSEIAEENKKVQEAQQSQKRSLDQELNDHMKKHFGLSIVNLPDIKGDKRNCRIAQACQSSSHKESNASKFNKEA